MDSIVFDINLFLQWVEEQIYERPESVPNLLELMKLSNSTNDTRMLDIAEAFETHLMTAAAQELENTPVWDFVNKLLPLPTKEAQELLETTEGWAARTYTEDTTPQTLRFQAIVTWKQMGSLKFRDPSWYNPTCYIVSAKNLAHSWHGIEERWGVAFRGACKDILNQRTDNE